MTLPSQALVRSELLTYLNARTAVSPDEACVHLAQRLGVTGEELSLTRDDGEPLFRRQVWCAKQELVQDGLVERGGDDWGQWRSLRHRDAADFPDELPPTSAPYYMERASIAVRANKYERNRVARRRCIEHHGARCSVCEFDFEEVYGELGRGCIQVHHIVPLATIGHGYELDPVRDLRPICPNCHYMIHRAEPAYSIEQLRVILRRQRTAKRREVEMAPAQAA